jgi:tricorn protease-like protein
VCSGFNASGFISFGPQCLLFPDLLFTFPVFTVILSFIVKRIYFNFNQRTEMMLQSLKNSCGVLFGRRCLRDTCQVEAGLSGSGISTKTYCFVYAGDIWTVNANGGEARRLTSHEGLELFPKISPDGKWIAFSAEYSGSRQVYVMPSVGGEPRQLTYYNSVGVMPPRGGFDDVVLDWTPDSKQVLIRANRTEFGERKGKYFQVTLKGARKNH